MIVLPLQISHDKEELICLLSSFKNYLSQWTFFVLGFLFCFVLFGSTGASAQAFALARQALCA
jgi:hypothetical protein